MRKSSVLLCFLLVLAAGCAEEAKPEAVRYTTPLEPVNNSGVEGSAEIVAAGPELTLRINATGLEANRTHEQNLYGFVEPEQEARCPTSNNDRNGNGVVELEEATSDTGAKLLPLEPYPTVDEDGKLQLENIFEVDRRRVGPLEDRILVLQGKTVPLYPTTDPYVRTIPVACGRLVRAISPEG